MYDIHRFDARNILWRMGTYSIKKVHNILLYDAGQFYVKNKMAAKYKSVKPFPEQLKGKPIN